MPVAYRIGENGSLHWKDDSSEVVFRLDGTEVFTIATRPFAIPQGAAVAGTGEIRAVKTD